jgi:hypothetical protein
MCASNASLWGYPPIRNTSIACVPLRYSICGLRGVWNGRSMDWVYPGHTHFQVFQNKSFRYKCLFGNCIANYTTLNNGEAREFLYPQFCKNVYCCTPIPSKFCTNNKILSKNFTFAQSFTNFPAFNRIQNHYCDDKNSPIAPFYEQNESAYIFTCY